MLFAWIKAQLHHHDATRLVDRAKLSKQDEKQLGSWAKEQIKQMARLRGKLVL